MGLIEETLEAMLSKPAMDFFVAFSRVKCALKRSGSYATGNDQRVDLDWNGSARGLGPGFMGEVVTLRFAPHASTS